MTVTSKGFYFERGDFVGSFAEFAPQLVGIATLRCVRITLGLGVEPVEDKRSRKCALKRVRSLKSAKL
ncbi:MAG: hypothetical protein AAGJ46_12080 [Planctomycetota bacterium]